MLGMMQLMIWLLCIYLIFKGIEIYQIANMSSREDRNGGKNLGTAMIVAAIVAALVFFVLEEQVVAKVSDSQRSLPSLYP